MFCCLLKKELTFTLSRLETNYASFSQVKFLVFESQPVFSKLSEAAPLDERDRISITSTPSLHYRTCTLAASLSLLELTQTGSWGEKGILYEMINKKNMQTMLYFVHVL